MRHIFARPYWRNTAGRLRFDSAMSWTIYYQGKHGIRFIPKQSVMTYKDKTRLKIYVPERFLPLTRYIP